MKTVQLQHAWTWTCPECRHLNTSHGNTVIDDESGEGGWFSMAEHVVCATCLNEFKTDEGE